MFRRQLGLFVLSALLILGAACGSSPSPGGPTTGEQAVTEEAGAGAARTPAAPAAGKAVELTMLTSWSPDVDRGKALQKLVDQYNRENEGKVRVKLDINPDWPALQEKIKTMIAADQTPDFFNYNLNPNNLSIQESGKLMDFTPYMDEEWKTRFDPKDLEALTFNGQLLSIPFEQNGVPFMYNKAHLAKAGIEEFPKTWDDFFTACQSLKDAGITPLSLMTTDDAWHATNIFTYLAASIGGPDVFAVDKPLDEEVMTQAAASLQKAFDCSTKDAVGANYSVSSSHFLSGRTAVISDGPWLLGQINEQVQDPDQIGMATGPAAKNGKGQPGLIVTDAMTPWAAGKQKTKEREEAVVDFMKFFTSEEAAKILTFEGNLPLALKHEFSAEDTEGADPLLLQHISTVNDASEKVVQVSRVLKPAAIAELPSLLESLALGQTTPEQFASRLAELNE